MHVLFVFSSIQPNLTVAVAAFFLFRVHVGKCPSPSLLWNVPHNSHCYKLSPLQDCWVSAATPAFSCSGHPTLFATCLLFSAACLLFSLVFFPFFPLGQGHSVQGAISICTREYHVLLICSPVGLPSRLGAGIWWHGSPPGFSI
jgi:hypothetical protein